MITSFYEFLHLSQTSWMGICMAVWSKKGKLSLFKTNSQSSSGSFCPSLSSSFLFLLSQFLSGFSVLADDGRKEVKDEDRSHGEEERREGLRRSQGEEARALRGGDRGDFFDNAVFPSTIVVDLRKIEEVVR